VGLRYGSGWLIRKTREPEQVIGRPSVGSMSGQASKCFPLVYNLRENGGCFSAFRGWKAAFTWWRG